MSKTFVAFACLAALALLGVGAWTMLEEAPSTDALLSGQDASAATMQGQPIAEENRNQPDASQMSAVALRREELRAAKDEIAGRVYSSEGALIADAKVTLTAVPPHVSQNYLFAPFECSTNADGVFRAKTLVGARYALVVTAAGHQPSARQPIYSGTVVDFDLLLGARLSVVVTDAVDGSPIEGVRVKITRANARTDPNRIGLPACSGTTSNDGRVHFDELVPGTFECSLLAKAHADLNDESIDILAASEGAPTTEKRWQLQRGKQVRGVVRSANLREPIAGAIVAWEHKQTLTDKQGAYVLQGLPAAALSINALALGWIAASADANLQGTRLAVNRDFLLQPAGVIAGIVLDPDGNPMAGARVSPVHAYNLGQHVYDIDAHNQRTVTTGADGRFEVSGFPLHDKPEYAARAALKGWPTQISQVVALDANAPRAEVTIRMARPSAVLQGLVVDEADQPIADAVLLAYCYGRVGGDQSVTNFSTHTLQDGAFIFASLPDGTVNMEASAPGFTRARGGIEIVAGQPQGKPPRLVLRRGQTVQCLVLDADGKPVDQSSIQVRSAGIREYSTTGADGTCSLIVVGTPPWSVTVTAPRHEEWRNTKFFPDADNLLKITVQRGTLFKLAVRERGSMRPLDEFHVRTFEVASVPNAKAINDPNRARFSRTAEPVEVAVQQGKWRVVVSADGFLPSEITADAPLGIVTDLGVIELDRGVSLDGVVRLRDGGPVQNARVLTRALINGIPDAAFRELGRSDQDGWVHRAGLRPGTYDIAVESELAPLVVYSNMRIDAEQGRNLDLELVTQTKLTLSTRRDPVQQTAPSNRIQNLGESFASNFEFNGDPSELSSMRWSNSRPRQGYSYVITEQHGALISFEQGPKDPVAGTAWIAVPRLTQPARGRDLLATIAKLPKGDYRIEVKLNDASQAQHALTLSDDGPMRHQFDLRSAKPPAEK